MSFTDLHNLGLNSGKYAMQYRLAYWHFTSWTKFTEQADKVSLRSDPLIRSVCLIQSYTSHVLRPHIYKISQPQRFFPKIPFINKGIGFIDLQNMLGDKNASDTIQKYFENIESPIIYYKYNKSIRNTISIYHKIVADLNINENMPHSWESASSKCVIHPRVIPLPFFGPIFCAE